MGTRLYPLPSGDGDGIKLWYPLGLDMGMGMNFFYGDGYEIAKPAPLPSLGWGNSPPIFIFKLFDF